MVIKEIKKNISFMSLMRLYHGKLKPKEVKYLCFHKDEYITCNTTLRKKPFDSYITCNT